MIAGYVIFPLLLILIRNPPQLDLIEFTWQ